MREVVFFSFSYSDKQNKDLSYMQLMTRSVLYSFYRAKKSCVEKLKWKNPILVTKQLVLLTSFIVSLNDDKTISLSLPLKKYTGHW